MNLLKWLVTSSANAQKYSLMVKGVLMFGVAKLIALMPVLCGFHIACIAVDGTLLSSAVDTIANIVYLGLSLIGSLAFLYGLARKLWNGRWSAFQAQLQG
jgi:hypothetical protein